MTEQETQSDATKSDDTQSDEQQKAQDAEQEHEEAKEEIKALEENPPEKLEDWPDGAAKYETFGGPEGEHSYEEGPEQQLGPSGLRHHEDGKVSIDGEEVDDPDEYKGDPIPGGPTDPDAPENRGEGDSDDSES